MSILLCTEVEERFSSYLDSSLSGAAMAEMHEHLEHCAACMQSFEAWQATMRALGELRPVKPPDELSLRLRLAVSHAKARTPQRAWERLRMQWQSTGAPLAMRFSAGLVSAVLLFCGVLFLIGTFAAPEPATARDEPIGTATQPKLLYVAYPDGYDPLAALDGSVVVRVYVNAHGRVYDYHVLSGTEGPRTQAALESGMMWSVFEPAQVFGEPVPGTVILSFTGVSVPG